jgi:nicotinate-nucleotide adenylyltransferase
LFKDRLETVALFGGSFDPPHFGHKAVVEEALKLLDIEKLIVVPTFLNPFKTSSFSSVEERFLMSVEMFKSFDKVEVNRYEIEENKSTPTAQTLSYFKEKYEVKYIIIGADNLNSIEKWYNFKWLNEEVTWVIASRAGYKLLSNKLRDFKILNVDADISSTQIRNIHK